MIVILGASGSGKTTLVNSLIEKDNKYHRIVTYTTRPIRYGEEDGTDYHFLGEEEFDRRINDGFFAETDKYRGYFYGTAKEDCNSKNAIAILTPTGLRTLKKQGIDIFSVYLGVDRRSRLVSLLNRGDDVDIAYRTTLIDTGEYKGVEHDVDVVLNNYSHHISKEELPYIFLNYLRLWENELSHKIRDK